MGQYRGQFKNIKTKNWEKFLEDNPNMEISTFFSSYWRSDKIGWGVDLIVKGTDIKITITPTVYSSQNWEMSIYFPKYGRTKHVPKNKQLFKALKDFCSEFEINLK